MSDTYAYQGFQDGGTGTTDYNSLVFIIQREMAKMNVGVPVKVVTAPYTVDSSGTKTPITPGAAGPIGYIDVLPLVNQVDGNNAATPHETVHLVAYHRPQGGNGAFISDPVVGDIGHMTVPDRDTSVVLSTSAQGNPGSGRRNDLSDGVYLGTIRSGNPSQSFAFLAQGFKLVDAFGNTMIGTAAGVTINGVLITLAGDVVTKKGTDLDTHVHTGVTTGAGDTGPPA